MAATRKKATRKAGARTKAAARRKAGTRKKATRKRGARGPAPTYIDPEQLKRLAAIHCTHAEIAHAFEISERTFERRLAADPKLRAIMDGSKCEMRRALRRVMFGLGLQALNPNAPRGAASMAIYLSKQPEKNGGLGMSDRTSSTVEFPQWDEDEARNTLLQMLDKLEKRSTKA